MLTSLRKISITACLALSLVSIYAQEIEPRKRAQHPSDNAETATDVLNEPSTNPHNMDKDALLKAVQDKLRSPSRISSEYEKQLEKKRETDARHHQIDASRIVLLNLAFNTDTDLAIREEPTLANIQRSLKDYSQDGMKQFLTENRGRVVIIMGHNDDGKLIARDSSRIGSPIDLRQLDSDADEVGTFPIVLSCWASCYVRAGTTEEVNSVDMVRLASRISSKLLSGTFLQSPTEMFFWFLGTNLQVQSAYGEKLRHAMSYDVVNSKTRQLMLQIHIPTCLIERNCHYAIEPDQRSIVNSNTR